MDWIDLEFFHSSRFNKIANLISEQRKLGKSILPGKTQVLRALALTPPDKVNVVILGQDPYPTKGHANGLAFSVNPGVSPLPKSLKNIFQELKDDIGVVRTNGDLTDWAKQGVLLLNTTLTVIEGTPGSHSGIGWEILTTDVIKYLSEHHKNLVYILWGKHAQNKEIYINPTQNKIIKSPHPSPLSAHRGFFGSKPFSETNKYLMHYKDSVINW